MSDQDASERLAVILTTVATEADAASIARALVDERLAACVNILPAMRSVYRWQGTVNSDEERQLVIKTTPDRLAAIELRLASLHPYEVPEFVVLSATASMAYASWARESVTP